MKRCLKIEKFRNIGIDKEETIMLNSSLEKGEQGNLVILIGENNSGKSNVLDALRCFGNKRIEQRDVTNLEFDEKYHKPTLSMVTIDGNKEYICSLKYNRNSYNAFVKVEGEEPLLTRNEALEICKGVSQYQSNFNKLKDVFQNEKSSEKEIEEAMGELIDSLSCHDYDLNRSIQASSNSIVSWINKNHPDFAKKLKENDFNAFSEQYSKHYGISLVPTVITYQDQKIADDAMCCPPNAINAFLGSVLEDIGYKKEDVVNAYRMFNAQKNHGILEKLESELNKKVVSISKKFNSIYKVDERGYKFLFRAESTAISLSLYKNNEPCTLAHQSTGFRWFFDLYFNLLSKSNMKSGDIIVMDGRLLVFMQKDNRN